jgi:RNA polymerase sigma factor (sigma-70 family)
MSRTPSTVRPPPGDDANESDESDGADGAPPSSVLRGFPCRSPPTAAELRELSRSFPAVMKTYSPLVWHKILRYGDAIDPPSREDLHQEVFLRLWSLLRRLNRPASYGATIGSICFRTLHAYLRRRVVQARHAREARQAGHPGEAGTDPGAFFLVLLHELEGKLAPDDVALLRWDAEGLGNEEIGAQLGVPLGTVKTRLRAARARLTALVDPPSSGDRA